MEKVIQTEDGSEFTVDSEILISQSKYFKALFQYDHRPCILVRDINGNVMKQILHFLQTKSVEFNENDMFDVLKAADYLMLEDIVNNVCRAVPKEITPENCIDFFLAALSLNHTGISQLCYSYIQTHFQEVVQCADMGKVSFEHLRSWLTDRNLYVDSEEVVCKAIVKWVEANQQERIQKVPSLLACIRLDACDEECIRSIMSHPIAMQNKFLSDVMTQKTSEDCLQWFAQFIESCVKEGWTCSGPRMQAICAVTCDNGRYAVTRDLEVYVLSAEAKTIANLHMRKNGRPRLIFDCDPQKIYVFFDEAKEYFCVDLMEFTKFSPLARAPCENDDTRLVACCLNRQLYSVSLDANSGTLKAAVYLPEQDQWNEVGSIVCPEASIPASLDATAHEGLMYAVVAFEETSKTFGGVFDPNANAWMELPLTDVASPYLSVVSFNGLLLLLRRDEREILRFHPEERAWRHCMDMPSGYNLPRAVVRNQTLLVYGERNGSVPAGNRSPFYWDAGSGEWHDGSGLLDAPLCRLVEDPDVVRKYHRQFMEDEWSAVAAKWTESRSPKEVD